MPTLFGKTIAFSLLSFLIFKNKKNRTCLGKRQERQEKKGPAFGHKSRDKLPVVKSPKHLER